MKKNQNLFFIFIKNSFRILVKSKTLILLLGTLIFTSITILVTAFMSGFLMIQSKNDILKNSNLADATVTVPEIQNSSVSYNELLEEYLKTNSWTYTYSKNLPISDLVNNNNFILSTANIGNVFDSNDDGNSNVVNKLVLKNGNYFSQDTNYSNVILKNIKYFYSYAEIININNLPEVVSEIYDSFQYETYMNNKPWELARLLLNANWNASEILLNKVTPILEQLSKQPSSLEDYKQNYCVYQNTTKPTTITDYVTNENSLYAKLGNHIRVGSYSISDFGITIILNQVIPLIGVSGEIPFTVNINQYSSYFSILSSNYMNANLGNKKVISTRTYQDALGLPFKQNNLNNLVPYYVYNQDTQQMEEFYDFVSWFEQLDNKYKISVNSNTFGIIGIGDSPNLLYPAQSATEMFVDSSKNGVSYLSNSGFSRAIESTSYKPYVYYSVRYPPDANFFDKNNYLGRLKDWTLENFGEITAYSLKDSKQPNFIFYLWANFLNNIQYIVLWIGSIIGAIILILGLIFISLLLRSIVKQNIMSFAIGLANGVGKWKLAMSFFPFALVPALIFGTLAFFISYLLTTPTIGIISEYWTLAINQPKLYVWIWAVIVVALFILLYIITISVIVFTLHANTQTLLSSPNTFKVNKLIIWTKKTTQLLNPIWSFRTTLVMSNISRFIVLLFIVITFITLTSLSVSSINVFANSLKNNIEEKKYYSAIDLYSPTINSGYYSDINYNELGTSQQGSYNAYDPSQSSSNYYNAILNNQLNYKNPLNMKSDFYTGPSYYNSLSYPYRSNLFFTSLFLTNSNLSNEINWNAKFLDNRSFNKLLLDVEVNALGAIINPWDFAKQIIPSSIAYLADYNTEKLAQTNIDFYYWLQEQNKIAVANDIENFINIPNLENTNYSQFNNKPIFYSTYLPNVSSQPLTLDGSDITEQFDLATNKNQWIFIRSINPTTNSEYWQLNKDYALYSAPSYTYKEKTVALFTQLLTNIENPLFQFWYKYCYDKNPNKGIEDQIIPDYNYKIAANVAPLNTNDETYTYVNIDYNLNNKDLSAKVIGIKPNTEYVSLVDGSNKNLINLLIDYEVSTDTENDLKIYPLIINNVVAKKMKLNIGSKILATPTNTFDRFNLLNIYSNDPNYSGNINDYLYKCNFEVVGIVNTNFEEQYYTLQNYANEILGYGDFSNSPYTNGWLNTITPQRSYVPYNGIFSSDSNILYLNNFGGFYTISGLSNILGNLDSNLGTGPGQNSTYGAVMWWLENNYDYLDRLMRINYVVDRANSNAPKQVTLTGNQVFTQPKPENVNLAEFWGDWSRKFIQLFGTNSFITQQLINIDLPSVTSSVGSYFDNGLSNINSIIIAAFVPTLLILVALISIIVIFESRNILSILKVLGYNNLQTSFSLAFIYYSVLIFGTLLSVPASIILLEVLKLISFNLFNIIMNPILNWWVFIAGFVGIGLIISTILLYFYIKMKKLNPTIAIAVR